MDQCEGHSLEMRPRWVRSRGTRRNPRARHAWEHQPTAAAAPGTALGAPGWSWVSLLSEGRGWLLGHPPCTFSFFQTKGTPSAPSVVLLSHLRCSWSSQLLSYNSWQVEAGLQAVTGNRSQGCLEDRQLREGGSFCQPTPGGLRPGCRVAAWVWRGFRSGEMKGQC